MIELKLLPCRACGNDALEISEDFLDGSFTVECGNCGRIGTMAGTRTEAINLWNAEQEKAAQ